MSWRMKILDIYSQNKVLQLVGLCHLFHLPSFNSSDTIEVDFSKILASSRHFCDVLGCNGSFTHFLRLMSFWNEHSNVTDPITGTSFGKTCSEKLNKLHNTFLRAVASTVGTKCWDVFYYEFSFKSSCAEVWFKKLFWEVL